MFQIIRRRTADCVGFLAAGALPQVFPPTKSRDDEETRKRLMAVLLNGAKALVWDNVIGGFDSAAMASFLTAPTFTDRILGKSVTSSVPNRVFMVFTGNNIIFEGDMPRRVLICRIDPRSTEPFAREFDVSPYDYVVEHRQEMAIAACTLIKAQLLSDTPKAAGRLASFETWDNLVRQTVVGVGKLLDVGAYGDPMDLVREAQAVDPSLDGLGDLLVALHDQFGGNTFTAKDVQKVCAAWNMGPLNQALREYSASDISGSSLSIGRILSSVKGRIANGLSLTASSASNTDAKTYRVEQHNR